MTSHLNAPLLGGDTSSSDDHIGLDVSPTTTENSASGSHSFKGFSPFIAVCFTVNFMVGTGFLTLPWAFVQGGLISSTIFIIAASIVSDFVKDFLLEGMARAEAVVPLDKEDLNGEEENLLKASTDEDEMDSEFLMVKERKFEMSDLIRIFVSERSSVAFVTLLSFSLFMTLWVYTVVFVDVFQDLFPVSSDREINAVIYSFIYAAVVVPLSCMELREQVFFQVLLACCRFTMFFSMVLTTSFFPDEFRHVHSSNGDTENFIPAPLFRFVGISRSLPILLFALSFQTTVPGISQNVADKRQLSGIFRTTFFLCAICYTLVGVCVGSAAGEAVPQSSNVMWKNFRGGTGELTPDGEYINVALWAKFISYFVVMFPALDVISAFPLNAIVLGSNLLDVFFTGEGTHLKVSATHFHYHHYYQSLNF